MKTQRLYAYAVAAQFGDMQQNYLVCCPYVAASPELATASVVAMAISEHTITQPLQAVQATPLPVEWMRGALAAIEEREKAEEAEKPKVVQLVSERHPVAGWQAEYNAAADSAYANEPSGDTASIHSLACPKRWGNWGHCLCHPEHGDGAV